MIILILVSYGVDQIDDFVARRRSAAQAEDEQGKYD